MPRKKNAKKKGGTALSRMPSAIANWSGPDPISGVSHTVEIDRSILLMPLSDVHWPHHNDEALRLWREVVLSTPDSKVVLVGDLFELERTTESMQLRVMDPHGGVNDLVETYGDKCVNEMVEFLSPIKDRIVGCVPGNHAHIFRNGMTSDELVASRLGLWDRYRPAFGFIRFRFIDGQSKTVVIHHNGGSPGGRTLNADLNVFKRAEGAIDADVYCLGHTHRMHVNSGDYRPMVMTEDGKLVPSTGKIYMRCGTFAAHEFEGPGSYAAKKLFAPTEFGWTTLKLLLLPSGRIISDMSKITL